MIRVGLVGCGFIGTVHSYALRRLRDGCLVDARVTATFDPHVERAEQLAAHHDATAAPSLDALLDQVDVAWVCTWTAAHLEAVTGAAERGIAVFCEKPLAPDLAGADAVARRLRAVPHQVGLVLRHAPVFRHAAEAIRSGRFGRPLAAVLRDDQYFPIQGMYGSTWRADVARAGGGALLEHSIHDVDVLGTMLGPPASVSARVASVFGYRGIDDTATVTLAYPSGASATVISVWHQVTSRPSTRRLEVFCEDALLWTDDDYLGPLHVETATRAWEVHGRLPAWVACLHVPDAFAKPLAQYAEPTKAFLDALARDGREARGDPDVEPALEAHRVVDAAYRSAEGGGAPVVPDVSVDPAADPEPVGRPASRAV